MYITGIIVHSARKKQKLHHSSHTFLCRYLRTKTIQELCTYYELRKKLAAVKLDKETIIQ